MYTWKTGSFAADWNRLQWCHGVHFSAAVSPGPKPISLRDHLVRAGVNSFNKANMGLTFRPYDLQRIKHGLRVPTCTSNFCPNFTEVDISVRDNPKHDSWVKLKTHHIYSYYVYNIIYIYIYTLKPSLKSGSTLIGDQDLLTPSHVRCKIMLDIRVSSHHQDKQSRLHIYHTYTTHITYIPSHSLSDWCFAMGKSRPPSRNFTHASNAAELFWRPRSFLGQYGVARQVTFWFMASCQSTGEYFLVFLWSGEMFKYKQGEAGRVKRVTSHMFFF